MSLTHVALGDLGEHHLSGLVERGVRELGRMEYKRELPGGKDRERKEFLGDVSSFGNAGGGDLVFGIDEVGGAPTELVGLDLADPDAEVSRWNTLIRDGLDPRLVGYRVWPVPIAGGRHVMVVRVPNSFNSPHAVSHGGHFRYYGRTSNGKYPMDAGEVRGAVLASESVAQRMRSFRAGRLAAIASGEGPADHAGAATVVLHVMPLASFGFPEPGVDLDAAHEAPGGFRPMDSGGDETYNFDGLLMHDTRRWGERVGQRVPESYALLFRSGVVEAASSKMLWPMGPNGSQKHLPGPAFGRQVVDAAARYLGVVSHLGMEGPIYVALSLLGVRGYEMLLHFPSRVSSAGPIDRDALVAPEVMARELPATGRGPDGAAVGRLMRPVFDRVWNACGYPRATVYDAAGNMDVR